MFVAELTNLHVPTAPAIQLTHPLVDYGDLSVEIPLNDTRSGGVSFRFDNTWNDWVWPYEVAVRVSFTPTDPTDFPLTPLIWGKVPKPVFDGPSRRTSLAFVDPMAHLEHHYLRIGDTALKAPPSNPWNRHVPVDWQGMKIVIDAARNITSQNARGVPDIGIFARADYSDTADTLATTTKLKMRFSRGDEVKYAIDQLVQHDVGPDYRLRPLSAAEVQSGDFGNNYVELEIFDRLGTASPAAFYDGWHEDNADVQFAPGGKLITHAHVLSQDMKKRITAVEFSESGDAGVYVAWEVTGYRASDVAILEARGNELIAEYGQPPRYCTVKPKPDCQWLPLKHYNVGDTVYVSLKKDRVFMQTVARIMKMTIKQTTAAGDYDVELDVIPDLGSADIS